jgi:7-carboxy-7-deazaguanine synthase
MKLSELYTSVQGEGPDVGRLTQFVRFAGCNLRCPGWPCDTEHAINPAKYRNEWETIDTYTLYGRIVAGKLWHITLTGGEPFLQKEEDLDTLVNVYAMNYEVNIFTNGTLEWPDWVEYDRVKMIMDWKLPGSGEDGYLETRLRNLGHLRDKDAVKFVCVDKGDYNTAIATIEAHPELFQYVGHLYVGAAWGKVKEAEVVEWMKERNPHNFKLNVQVHNYLWDRNARRT